MGAHTRLFETLVPDELVIAGMSQNGGWYREHAGPCKIIRDLSFGMYDKNMPVEAVAAFIEAHLKIVFITPDEAQYMNGFPRSEEHNAQ